MPVWITRISLVFLLLALAAGILPRALVFSALPGGAEDILGDVLVAQFHIFLTIVGFLYLYAIQTKPLLFVLIILAAYLLIKTFYCLRHRKIAMPIEAAPLLAVLMIFFQFFADLSPQLMISALIIIAIMMIQIALIRKSAGNYILVFALLASVIVSAISLVWMDIAEVFALCVFAAIALTLLRLFASGRLTVAAYLIITLTAMPTVQVFSAWLPSVIRYPGATLITAQPALSFCESQTTGMLFAVHPQCPLTMFADKCRNAFIGAYDLTGLEARREIRPFNSEYFGRPEQLICHKGQIFVGMNGVRIRNVNVGANTMLIDYTQDHVRIWKDFAGSGIGNSLVYDAKNDALFLSAEFDQRIYRWDFTRQQMQKDIGDLLPNPWYRALTGSVVSGSIISHHDGISDKHNAVYFAEWINGRLIHEVDRTTMRPKRRLRFNGGASVGVTVDEELDRLWVSHLWGVSVFDLQTGQLLAKHRAGFINRPAVIDKTNNLVFSGATASGRIHAFDRQT
ncbi:MAG: hypothetical protein JNJ69_01040, partial [Leptospiraceae bacterium]|nr:hypothetical protein [Leptospiraceae bacterium]